MARKFYNLQGRVFRGVLTYTEKLRDGSESQPVTQVFGPYTRRNDASAALTRESWRSRIIKSAVVEVGTVEWNEVD